MRRLSLTLGCGNYEKILPLKDGTVRPEAIDLTVLTMPTPQRLWRMRQGDFDICEHSLSTFTHSISLGEKDWQGIPVFLHRRFRHSYIFVNSKAGIESPQDLVGKRVGLRHWLATAGVWARGILQSEYGVPLDQIEWFVKEEKAEGYTLTFNRYTVRPVPKDKDMDDMLVNGEIDALIYPEMPPSFVNGDPRVRRLFADAKAEEQAYFRKTGMFPIMHITVIRSEVLEKDPWVANTMLEAFRKAKEIAYQRFSDPRRAPVAWAEDLLLENKRVLGDDPFPYGVEENRRTLEQFLQYAYEQEIIPEAMPVERLFAPSVLGEPPRYFRN